ncbi:MAG: hypothetical protein P4M00_24770 [Azospirillaceae bacterium]|nr:hypothetical protein [Azospirillaceae bacterium]
MTHEMRPQVEQMICEEIQQHGRLFDRADLSRRVTAMGVSKRTLYRWIDAVLYRTTPAGLGAAAATAGGARDGGMIPVLEKLRTCIAVAEQVIAQAEQGVSGGGKRAGATEFRLLLMASEHLRRTMETAAKLHDRVTTIAQLERFHAAIFDELRAESPEIAERVVRRLQRINVAWGGATGPDSANGADAMPPDRDATTADA